MKKALLITLALGISCAGWAQKAAIQSAISYLNDKDYEHAIEYIEKATVDPSTSQEPKTWYTKGNIYYAMQQDAKYKDANPKPYKTAAASYMKTAELKPDYQKDMPPLLYQCAIYYFNDGIGAFNNKNFDECYADMKGVVDIHNVNSGKMFTAKNFDTIAMKARLMMANSLFYGNKTEDALVLYTELKDNPVTKAANIYMLMADIYKKQNKDAQWLAIVQEGRKEFPNDENLKADELNFYIKAGKQDELAKKLEEAVAKEPNNAELQYTLATTYERMAFADGPKPANYTELLNKSEKAFLEAIKTSPGNSAYNYNLGALYINEGSTIMDEMNKINGTSAADTKKYNDLKVQHDAYMDKALPYLEKVFVALDAKVTTLKGEDRDTYMSTVRALRQLYAKQNKMDKVAEMKQKEDAFNK